MLDWFKIPTLPYSKSWLDLGLTWISVSLHYQSAKEKEAIKQH